VSTAKSRTHLNGADDSPIERGEAPAPSRIPWRIVIVSHEHRFVYVQVPQTGSSAIGTWMVEHLGGVRVLRKHTTLPQARRLLGKSIDGYLVIASVRDSLDQFVSSYFKTLNRPATGTGSGGWFGLRATSTSRVEWAQSGDPSLDSYIDRFVRRPHGPVYTLSLRAADLVLRYEEIGAASQYVTAALGVGELPPVPQVNSTDRARSDLSELASPGRYERVVRYHRPFRHEWGYTEEVPSRFDRLRYEMLVRTKEVERRRVDPLLKQRLGGEGSSDGTS
jgi:hypothetical protein